MNQNKIGILIMFIQLAEEFATAMKSLNNTDSFSKVMTPSNNADQLSTAMKPFNGCLEISTKMFVTLINQQAVLMTTIIDDSVTQMKVLSEQTDLAAVIEAQQFYAEELQAIVSVSAKEAYDVVTKTSEEVATLVKESMESAAITDESSPVK
jgi:phasin family protein